ncbi:glycoside hydrolase family 97 protein [Parafilimonas sp.]|uniref:glycoside hydrolase family 97 protein n=1 Tax=Parafilimonas sp. TaxID=1969739 RepID=UPI0039E2A578
MKSTNIIFFCICFFTSIIAKAQRYTLASPDSKTKITVDVGSNIEWSVAYNNNVVLQPSALSLELASGKTPGVHAAVKKAVHSSVNETITSPVPVKNKIIPNLYNQLQIQFKGDYNVTFRAYNDGVAYRFETMFKDSQTVKHETAAFNFAAGYETAWPYDEPFGFGRNSGQTAKEPGFGSKNPQTGRGAFGGPPPSGTDSSKKQSPPRRMTMPASNPFNISYEYLFRDSTLNAVTDTVGLPVYMSAGNGVKLVLLEADLYDYPNLFVKGTGSNSLTAVFPPVVLKQQSGMGGMAGIAETADYIAKTKGTRTYPWRAIAISDDDKKLLENELVYKLSSPPVIPTDWIRPGQVVWEWWHASNLYNVNFEAGINTASYKYYIDFASKYNVPYMLIDAGWRNNPQVNIPEIADYAKQKNVGVMLWMSWTDLTSDMEGILDTFKIWGIKGVKMDYMNRADQAMVNVFEKVAAETAKRNMLIDFHGAYKPSGLNRKYPNVVNYEGVKGLEHDKLGSVNITPSHDVTIMFTRMVAGPMDYTPGALNNAAFGNFRNISSQPMSQGTRAHQAAMYVLYDAPIQMLVDNPSTYLKEDDYTKFITSLPTVWDTTIAIDGKIGQYAIVARRKDENWYIGAMTDWSKREIEIPLSFIGNKKYKLTAVADGLNADKYGSDYTIETKDVSGSDLLKINMNNGGGWVAKLVPAD